MMDSSSLITIDRSAPPTQTGIATVLRLQPPGDSRGVRWARAGSCFISGKLMPVKNGSLGPNTVVNSNQKNHLGNLRDPLGEFTRPTWGIYGTHLGNLRGPLGGFTKPNRGFNSRAWGGNPPWLGCVDPTSGVKTPQGSSGFSPPRALTPPTPATSPPLWRSRI